ncbi:hypothetical protein [Winogradskyella schleiferi]|uniref:hypothetical protein n=1 Tax=Winogradskyella schleiferi TaxID=2686078 RepID=UPI0015BD38A6|nr:hypothetical protein [Winogradskyella schleiferi]
MTNKILIITGMHRSGTSLTSNWLQRCSLNIGTELEGKKFSNPDGHFEDIDFLYLHEEILKSGNVPYHGTENPNDFIISKSQKKKIKVLLEQKNKSKEWGWKDPRTCLFLGVYRELIPSANYLVILRPYTEIIDSLVRRKYSPIERKIKSTKFGKLKLLKYELTLQKQSLSKEIEYYENAVINYYNSIIHHLELIDKEKRICFMLDDIQKLDNQIVSNLNNKMGFSLKYFPISNIFEKKYLKSEPKFYKRTTLNTSKLEALQNKLVAFCDY